jgi:hypothetical protein
MLVESLLINYVITCKAGFLVFTLTDSHYFEDFWFRSIGYSVSFCINIFFRLEIGLYGYYLSSFRQISDKNMILKASSLNLIIIWKKKIIKSEIRIWSNQKKKTSLK